MSIERESNTSRRHHRVSVPLGVTVGGQNYPAIDWSLGGFGLAEFDFDASLGQVFDAEIVLPYPEFRVSASATQSSSG